MQARVWEKFLTDDDKEHLRLRHDRRVGVGTRPALILIDLYRAVFGDKPEPLVESIKTWPNSCGMAGWNALPHIQKLLAAARAATIPVIHVTMLSGSAIPSWSEAAHRDQAKKIPDAVAAERKRRGPEILEEVAPIAGEAVIRKTAPSAFWGTPLVGHLNYLGVDTVFIAGESTSGCVRASVVDAVAYRYRVQVVEECVFDRHETTHALNLFDMHQKYADVVSIYAALSYLSRFNDNKLPGQDSVPA